MKFRVSLKAVLWSWLVLILLLVGLAYNAYDKLRPEAFVQLANEQIKKNIPQSELVVDSVDYSFSLDFNIKLKQITVIREQSQVAKIGELELKIPWWLLVTHRGTAQVNISQVEILLSSNDVKKIAKNDEGSSEDKAKTIEFEIPQYLSDAQFTLRAKDVALKNEDASRTYLQISKLLVREFALKKNSAFEIKLPVWFEHNGLTFNSEVWLFGDLTPDRDKWSFNYTGDFRTKDIDAKISFDDVALEGTITMLLPQFTIDAQNTFMIDKEEKGNASFKLDRSTWKLDLEFSALPMEFLALFEKEILNDYLKQFTGEAQGKIVLWQKLAAEEFTLNGNLIFPGQFKLDQLMQDGQWYLTFDNNLWVMRFENDQIKYSRENLIAFNQAQLMEIKESFELSELSFEDAFKFVPSLENVSKVEIPQSKSIQLTNVKRGDELFNGSFELSTNMAAFNYMGEMKGPKESLKFSYVSDAETALDLNLKTFKMVKGFELFSPWISGEGMLNMDFSGKELNQFPLGSWKLTGRIENENLNGLFISHLQTIWSEFDRNPKKQEFNFNMNSKNTQMKLIDIDQNPVTVDIAFNKNLSVPSTATMTVKGKKTAKKLSLSFLKKDS